MARITRSKKLQPLVEQTYSSKTRKKSTIVQGTSTQLHSKEIHIPLEEERALVVDLTKSNTALEMISGNVTANTNRKCKLVATSSDKSGNDFSNHCFSMKQVNKQVNNKDRDLNIKRPKNKKNANEARYMAKDASSRSTLVDSNNDDFDSSYLEEEQTVNFDELSKNSYKKSMDDTRLSGEILISENSMMNGINSGSVKIDDGEDSFIAQIISRSPAKPISRLEDSLEKLDQPEKAFKQLNEVAHVENMFKHKPHPKLGVLEMSNISPARTNKDVSVISPKISIISPAKIQSPSKIKKHRLSKATVHNDLTHLVQNIELQRNAQLNSSTIDSNKSHIRPTQGYPKKVSIKPLEDLANTRIGKSQFTTVVHQASTTGHRKVKESKSYSNLKAVNLHDDVFTRLSTATYKSRSSSQKTNEKATQVAKARISCNIPQSLYHKVSNLTLNSSNLLREKDTSTNVRRHLKTQTSQENPHKTKSRLVLPQDLKPPLASPLKQTSDSNCTTTLRKDLEFRAVDETCGREATPKKDIENELKKRKDAALLARTEAAEKGRRAVMIWAESQKTKR